MKKFKKSIMLICISFLLTGCVKFNITIDFNDEETASLQSTLLIKESDLNSYDMTIDSIKKQLISSSDFLNDWNIEETFKTIDNEKYEGIVIIAPESINKLLLKNFTCNEIKGVTTYELNVNFIKSGLDISELKNYKSTLTALKSNDASFQMIIKMPGNITESSLGQINKDTVTIDMYEYLISGSIPDLKIISKKENIDSHFYLYIILGILIIVCLIIIRYTTKKKRKKGI